MSEDSYPRVPGRNVVNRERQRGVYDYGTIHSILDNTPVLHVAFSPPIQAPDSPRLEDSFPAVLPMLGCTGSYGNSSATTQSPRDIYLHGYVSSRLMKLPSTVDNASTGDTPSGVPVCVAATSMDGVVLSLTPFHNSCNYRSAVAHGYASVVTDEAERMYAMELITDNLVPNRWSHSRTPPTKPEMQSTGILRVRIITASAKIRTGGPKDDRNDLKNESVRDETWTGVVPTWLQFGLPVENEKNLVHRPPAYMQDWLDANNSEGERYANAVANS